MTKVHLRAAGRGRTWLALRCRAGKRDVVALWGPEECPAEEARLGVDGQRGPG